ncbi:hypothetical protein [Candidatus Parabeggiatoa sp. HSG14]|uniref:YfaP family protein n=1 Tax=Candidatus Parabeggiatoa sp. HSG14 TaxID=3055593 RepID=UPI0025A6C416|nr:hypothetical protein [Thiotrichales bacterium HSG14]
MKTMIAYAFTSLLFASAFAQAQQNNCETVLEKFRVVFENGALTTPKQAFMAKNELALSLGNTYADQEITYDLAYNYSADAFEELLQSASPHHWYIELAQRVYNWKYKINAPELTAHVEKYREAIFQGQKVLVVSHSEGNFYANLARQILMIQKPVVPMEGFGLFGVATPANNVGGKKTPYLTNHLDIITSVPGSLPSNWTLRRADNGRVIDFMGSVPAHDFKETYLSPHYNIRSEMINGIKQELSKLKEPPQLVKTGSLTVTMTWNLDHSDVDLHVVEPDNTHVFYSSKTGHSGYLDVDNTRGFGPEHYYSDCNKLQVGKYFVGVNYYDDQKDENNSKPARQVIATVTISTPGSTRTFSIKIDDDIQTVGNSNPRKLAKVIIERISDPANPSRDEKLKYHIIPL